MATSSNPPARLGGGRGKLYELVIGRSDALEIRGTAKRVYRRGLLY